MSNYKKLTIKFNNLEECIAIIGANDKNLNVIKDHFKFNIVTRGEEIYVPEDTNEETVDELTRLFKTLQEILRYETNLTVRDIIYALKMLKLNQLDELVTIYRNKILVGKRVNGKSIYVKTLMQKTYVKAIESCDLVFGVGPAGTGKTYIAVVKAVHMLKQQEIKKIILTRPAVEAGESLGFLPGDLKEKVDPYLRPLYDALHDSLGVEQTETLIEKGVIEIAPLAYMRGRTLEDAYVILDEAQNTTEQQMKMFLTRLGFNSKMVVTGDISQVDLRKGERSGLKTAITILDNIKNIRICNFNKQDVIRHPLVQEVIARYEKHEDR
ncbi:PhoH family protein [Haloplasma contractile]|uniref:PhoH-like protein n=1 Tax=Haloplasma contractile SSD-17B TaxID=1033810 RepID=U2FM74_9MOLU|nr:PhoH family protein [Haloplasma contractile]ERJ13825.1 PhoH-like protein [Haloplasma contractile SSD-17B]